MASRDAKAPQAAIWLQGYDILADIGVRSNVYKVRPKPHDDVPPFMDDEEVCYALKLLDVGEGHELDPEQKKRALRQAQGLLVLHHTNIVHYHRAFFYEGRLCTMTEFAEEGTLHNFIYTIKVRGEKMDDEVTWHIFAQICHGLNMLHKSKLAHGALKTRNLLLFPESLYDHATLRYRCKLTDIAIPELQLHQRLSTLSGSTLRYLAPEVLTRRPSDEKVPYEEGAT